MKAITTKYVGPGNVKGSRVIASDGDGSRAIVSYDDSLSRDDAHKRAALKLIEKHRYPDAVKWRMVQGWIKPGVEVFVMDPETVEIREVLNACQKTLIAHCQHVNGASQLFDRIHMLLKRIES